MTLYNRTEFTLEQVEELEVLKTVRSNWRQRDITLYQHPKVVDEVVSVGVYGDGDVVVAVETYAEWRRVLESNLAHVITN